MEIVKTIDAARMLRVSQGTLHRMIVRGELEVFTIGRVRRVMVQSIHDYLARKLNTAATKTDSISNAEYMRRRRETEPGFREKERQELRERMRKLRAKRRAT
jgi:excisionase family DNA binding protein